MARVESIVPPSEHVLCKALHDRLCLEVQIMVHGVTLPPANEANGVRVDVRVEEKPGSACMEGAGTDVLGEVAMGGT